jgi:hypothetical protein
MNAFRDEHTRFPYLVFATKMITSVYKLMDLLCFPIIQSLKEFLQHNIRFFHCIDGPDIYVPLCVSYLYVSRFCNGESKSLCSVIFPYTKIFAYLMKHMYRIMIRECNSLFRSSS